MEQKIKVGITQGDINGVGYEVILKALAEQEIYEDFTPIIYGAPKLAAYHRKVLNLQNFGMYAIRSVEEANAKRVNVLTCCDEETHIELGRPTEESGRAAFLALQRAVEDLKNGQIDVLITAPINKKNIQSEDFHFPGHTEYLEQQAGGQTALMLLCAEKLRVGVVAGHIPISRVAGYITVERIVNKLRILNQTLKQDFLITKPRIAVLGLNPHAGDDGLLGGEEQTVIKPAIEQANQEGILAMGPYAADGLFGSDALGKFDAVLAMYHDQGLAPFKALAFDKGVNYTAGLPFIRTSPDHGTAYDIAGKDCADCSSFREALWLALDVYKNRKISEEINADPLQQISKTEREKNA